MDCNSEPFPVPEKAAKRAQSDIEFICKQLLRFAKMPHDERMAYLRKHPYEAFCQIPHPDGKGHFLCGDLARKRLGKLTSLVLDLDHGLGRRVGRQRARDAVEDAFVKRVLRERLEVNQETSVLLLQDALTTLRKSLSVTEHYFPCVFFPNGGPDEFSIGPVTFTRRVKFFKDRKLVFKHSVDAKTVAHIVHVNEMVAQGFPRERAYSEAESRKLVRGLQARSIKSYRAYPWVASVMVIDCDKASSKERAIRAVEIALHIVRLLLGAEPTRKLRLAWSQSEPLQTAHLYADANGVIQASGSSSALGPVAKNWHEALMQGSSELVALGSLLTKIVDPVEMHHLHQRLIDAINWFGDAATDSNASSSIVKYVSAIERLLFVKFEQGRTKTFPTRVKAILKEFGCDDDSRVYEQACKVYKIRSVLVHGSYSPTEDKAHEIVLLAEELSRMCLLCSTHLYLMMLQALGSVDPDKLEDVMKRISGEGLNWLAEAAAGYTASV